MCVCVYIYWCYLFKCGNVLEVGKRGHERKASKSMHGDVSAMILSNWGLVDLDHLSTPLINQLINWQNTNTLQRYTSTAINHLQITDFLNLTLLPYKLVHKIEFALYRMCAEIFHAWISHRARAHIYRHHIMEMSHGHR